MQRSACVARLAAMLLMLASAAGLSGCGGGTERTSAIPAAGPHGGALAALPGDQGFVEVLIEPAGAGKGATAKERVVAYFLDKGLQSPLATPASDVVVKLRQPDGEPIEAALSPDPKSGDSAGAARFASKPGTFAVDRPIGDLTATIGGQTFTGSFAASR
ncbi:MAG: hypothetical protein U0800_10190 [Isosphaeraceae bacterium]